MTKDETSSNDQKWTIDTLAEAITSMSNEHADPEAFGTAVLPVLSEAHTATRRAVITSHAASLPVAHAMALLQAAQAADAASAGTRAPADPVAKPASVVAAMHAVLKNAESILSAAVAETLADDPDATVPDVAEVLSRAESAEPHARTVETLTARLRVSTRPGGGGTGQRVRMDRATSNLPKGTVIAFREGSVTVDGEGILHDEQGEQYVDARTGGGNLSAAARALHSNGREVNGWAVGRVTVDDVAMSAADAHGAIVAARRDGASPRATRAGNVRTHRDRAGAAS